MKHTPLWAAYKSQEEISLSNAQWEDRKNGWTPNKTMKRSKFILSLLTMLVAPFLSWGKKKNEPWIIRYSIIHPPTGEFWQVDKGMENEYCDQEARQFIAKHVLTQTKIWETANDKGQRVRNYMVVLLPQEK